MPPPHTSAPTATRGSGLPGILRGRRERRQSLFNKLRQRMGKTLGTKRMSLTNESLYTGEQTLRCNAVLVSLMRSEGLHKSEVADQGAYGWTEQQHVMRKTCLEVAWKPQSQRNKPRSGPGFLGANSRPVVVLSKSTKTHTKKKNNEKKKERKQPNPSDHPVVHASLPLWPGRP